MEKTVKKPNIRLIDEDIASGNMKQVYLLYGTETYLVKQYKDKLIRALVAADDTMNFSRFSGDNINPGELIDMAETMPFFAERRVILVEDSVFFEQASEELTEYIASCAATTYFIFVQKTVDARFKLYKTINKVGRAIEFATQTDDVLTRWVLSRLNKEGKKITGNVMQLFLERCGTDMGNIDCELEKLICYTMGKEVIEASDVEAITTEQVSNKIFDMIGAISDHNRGKALSLYYDLLALKEPSMRILYLITRQFQILLNIRDMVSKRMDNKTIAANAGIPLFAAQKNVNQARNFTVEELIGALNEGVMLEEAVKTGNMNEKVAVEMFITKYSTKKPA